MKAPAFQFYADDFIGGTCAMTPAEVGAYLRLLCYQWGQGSIPQADPEKLARIAGCPVSPDVLAKFTDGKNARMEKVRVERKAFIVKQAANGKLGGRPPKPKDNPSLTQAFPKPNPSPNPNESSPVSGLRSPTPFVGDTPTPPCHPRPALPAMSGHADRVSAFFNRRSTTPWAAAELRAWKKAKAIVADTSAENWTLLESWFSIPDNDPRVIYRRTDMAALLNNWHAEITKAQKNIGSGSQSDFEIAMAEATRNGRKA